MEPDLYEVLQVQPAADPEVIDAAFRRLIRKYHPDLNPSPEATRAMQRLTAAYEVLRDPERRAAYDRERAARRKDEIAAQAPRSPVPQADPGQAAAVEVSLLGGLARLGIRRIRP